MMFSVGDRVWKRTGDYVFEGLVVAAFNKRSGVPRLVVEDGRGILMIFNARQLQLKCEDEGCAATIVHAEHFYNRVRYFCADHVAMSGHYERCPEPCAALIATMRGRTLP
jgi:hypothetical protein